MSRSSSHTNPIDAFIETIEKYPAYALEAAKKGMKQALLYLQGEIPGYPPLPAPNPDGVSFMNEKQRKWFFAAVRRGNVPGWRYTDGHVEKVGSARTTTLGKKTTTVTSGGVPSQDEGWQLSMSADRESVTGQIGTGVSYAPWVVGPDYPGEDIGGKTMYQARIHQGRWWQFYDVMEGGIEKAWETFEDYFWQEFLDRIHGNEQ